MKILFPYDGYESLGIGYLASIAIINRYDVRLHPLSFGGYIRGYKAVTTAKIEKEKNAILQLKPDIVAFSLNSFMADSLIRLASAIQKMGVKTIAGGPHCAAEPELTAQTEAFDGVIAGEADDIFIDSIESIMQGNCNDKWLFTPENKNAEYAFVKNLDHLPIPAKRLFYNLNRFEADDYKIITSRGCPYKCIFCSHSNPRVKSRYIRRSIDKIIEELILAKHNFNIKSVYFLDDVFSLDEDWIKDFMIIYKEKINLPFHAVSHPNNINERIASLLKEGGCYAMRLGVQTTTERIKKIIGRPEDNQRVIESINNLKKNKIKVEIDHIVNLPGESILEGRNNLKLYNMVRPDSIKVYWLMPLPGTQLFTSSLEQNVITSEQAVDIRDGKGFGMHSYLFYNRKFNNSKWLGIHLLLTYLPILPKSLVSFFIKIKADRILKIPSFSLIVGIPRLLNMYGNWDMVGKAHIKRIFYSSHRN